MELSHHRAHMARLTLADAEAFDALSGIDKARRLDARDPIAVWRLGRTIQPGDHYPCVFYGRTVIESAWL